MVVGSLSFMGPVFIIGAIIGAIILMIGIVFSLGLGSDLIAGYNSASEEQRSKIDEQKMMKISGASFIIFGLLAILSFYLYDEGTIGSWVLVLVPFVLVAFLVLVLNSKVVKKT